MSVRLSIGDFSKMTYLSVKALRRYHDMGLLVPATVDRQSGYRYDATEQVRVGQVIRRLRDFAMPLEQVKSVIEAPTATARNDLIVAHLRQMEEVSEHTQATVASLRALLEGPRDAPVPVEYRAIGPVSALAIVEPVAIDEIQRWWAAAFSELHRVVQASGAQPTGPDGALYSGEFFEQERGEVVAFVPVAPQSKKAGRAQIIEVRAAELAVIVHRGEFGDIDQTDANLGSFVAEREIGVKGHIREHYLITYHHTRDEAAHRTEVCWPVFPIKGEQR